MSIYTIPPSTPYVGATVSFGNKGDCPSNKRLSTPFYIDWSSVSVQTPAIVVNLNNTLGGIDQINALYVDNGRSHQGVYILFPDTGFRLTVPPFKRGVYPVLTNTLTFYASVFSPASGLNDHTVIHALNYMPPPYEGDAMIAAQATVREFDPVATNTAVTILTGTAWSRLREVWVELNNITNGAAGFKATFQILADAVVVAESNLGLTANEYVDANFLLRLTNQNIAAFTWTFTWTIVTGAITTGGAPSGVINLYTDAAEPN